MAYYTVEESEVRIQKAEELVKNSIYCKDDSKVSGLLSLVEDSEVGLDTETANTNSLLKAFDPLSKTARVRLIQLEGDNQIVMFDMYHLTKKGWNQIKEFLESDITFIMQNAKFDIKWLMKHMNVTFKKVHCTMLGSQLISAGKAVWKHSLADQVKNIFGHVLDKSMGASNWNERVLSRAQLYYAAMDTPWLRYLKEFQDERIKFYKLEETMEIENECLEPTAYIEICGMKMNRKRWLKIAERNKIRAMRMEKKIANFLQPSAGLFDDVPTFKVSSDVQLKAALEKAGYELPTRWDPKKEVKTWFINKETNKKDFLSDKGAYIKTIQTDYIEKLIERKEDGTPVKPLAKDVWQMMIKYSSLKQGYSFYGENWTEKLHPDTQRIHPDFRQIETDTGRFNCKEPNFQQIPTENIYRNCFIPEPDNKIVDADYDGCELRIVASWSKDPKMCKAFREGYDLHSYTASMIFGVPYGSPEVGKKSILRGRAKNLNFGIIYGIGAQRFAKNAGISEDEAQKMINEYFKIYKGLHRWLLDAKHDAVNKKESRTLSGRLFKHEFDPNNKKQVALAERNGCNFPIQGTNADIMKRALRLIYNECRSYAKMINTVHDQFVGEAHVSRIHEFKAAVERNMIKAGERYITEVPVLVDAQILDRWQK